VIERREEGTESNTLPERMKREVEMPASPSRRRVTPSLDCLRLSCALRRRRGASPAAAAHVRSRRDKSEAHGDFLLRVGVGDSFRSIREGGMAAMH
jgi:hypothetical protein